MPADPTPTETGARLDAAAGVLRAGVHLYQVMGTPLYSTLCAHGASDPDIVALVSRGREGAAAMHLFSAVHYLLLRDPGDSLSRYFATLTPDPAAPEDAFPEFVRFCREHREELLQLLDTRTVQTTFAERCRTVLPLLSRVADEAGEPLNLVEVGCSAGVLLTCDKYAYQLEGGGRVGADRCTAHVVARSNGWEAAAHSEDRYSHRTRSARGERQIRRRTSLAPGAQLSRASPTAGGARHGAERRRANANTNDRGGRARFTPGRPRRDTRPAVRASTRRA